jgi:hypothetical protein
MRSVQAQLSSFHNRHPVLRPLQYAGRRSGARTTRRLEDFPMRRIVAVIALGAAAVGCSTIDPGPKLKAATTAIEAAKAAGAANFAGTSDLLAQAEKYLAAAQGLIKDGNPGAALQQLSLASAAADDAKVKATDLSNQAKIKDLDTQIADLKAKLGK